MAKKNSALPWIVGLGTVALAGIGIYFYEKNAGTTAGTTTATGVNLSATVPGSSLTYGQEAALAASLNGTTVAAWQASGIPRAIYSQLSAGAQQGLAAYGVKVVG